MLKKIVMAGLDPAIHEKRDSAKRFLSARTRLGVDARIKSAHDDQRRV